MIAAKVIVKGADRFAKGLGDEHARHKKAMDRAVRVRGYKLMVLLRRELRAGAPGGKKFVPLSMMRRIMRGRGGRLGRNNPLAPLAKAVGYDAKSRPGQVIIGFGLANNIKLNSSTWRRIAKKQQEGFTTPVTETFFRNQNITIEEFLRGFGSQIHHSMFGGRKSRRRNVFFLKKETRFLKTPARPILEPFARSHKSEALAKIRRDFVRKLRGERI